MSKTYLIFILLVYFSLNHVAQITDKMSQLLDDPTSKEQTIYSGRRVLYERLVYKDSTSVREIFDYLTLYVEDDNTLAIYPVENFLYNYWLKRYDKVLNFALNMDSLYTIKLQKKKLPHSDDMMMNLIYNLRSDRIVIYTEIEASQYKEEEKDLLKLNFDQLLSLGEGKDTAVETLTPRSNQFLERYRASVYKDYVKYYLGLEFKTSKWNLAGEFFTGLGFYNGSVGNAIGPVIPLGITIEVTYQRVALKVIDYIGFSRTNDSITTKKASWRPNASARVFIPGITLGYYLIDKKSFKLCPFFGISSSSIGPALFKADKKENKNVGFDFTSTLTYGISMEIYLNEERETASNWISRGRHYFRVSYTFYQPHFEKKYAGYAGNMHSITLGYVMFENPRWRIK